MKILNILKSYITYQRLKRAGLFDTSFYLARNADVRSANVDPIRHYVTYGWRELRDPSASFSTADYLKNNPDVAASGMNPLLHYYLYGVTEKRSFKRPVNRGTIGPTSVDIIVPVYGALAEVRFCLQSIVRYQDDCEIKIIIVNDGSDEETSEWLREFSAGCELAQLIEHDTNKGYTQAVNSGLRVSTASYALLLNSDTIVTPGWLLGLLRCMKSDSHIGIVGPLSNAASWQNVPDLKDESGSFAVNELSDGMSVEEMARLVARASSRLYPRVPFVNGFCFMIRRAVLDAIGLMDEENFPIGYGEENDFCVRTLDAGFTLAIADDTYVFHAKSKSFGHERRKRLSSQGGETLRKKHGAEKVAHLIGEIAQVKEFIEIRGNVSRALLLRQGGDSFIDVHSLKVLFILPVSGGGGGTHSIVQEVCAMRRLGVLAAVAVRADRYDGFLHLYHDIPGAAELFMAYKNEDDLIDSSSRYNVAVATIYTSVSIVGRIVSSNPHIRPAYYVQDYEPLFFSENDPQWHRARRSYTLLPDAILFAKTNWIVKKVADEHGVFVHKVSPSIDHSVYRPAPRIQNSVTVLCAMIRPQTPRRGADRTMRVLARVATLHKDKVEVNLFGCDEETDLFAALPKGFPYKNHGVLLRPEVARLLAKSDIFIDLSDYQAFGRTALEGMACGATAVITKHGGADEYAVDNVNALLVDSFDEDICVDKIGTLISDRSRLRCMQSQSLLTASKYSAHSAAVSELLCLTSNVGQFSCQSQLAAPPALTSDA